MKWPGRRTPPKKSMDHNSWLHLRGFEEVGRSYAVHRSGARPRKSAYHSGDVHEENDMTGRDEQIAHCAGAQEWQRASRNLGEWDVRVLKLGSLDNSAD